MTIKPGTGGIQTIEEHGSIQLHIEWKTPLKMEGKGQGRGNSGIIFQRRYEVQVLDSYNNRTYSNGQAASIYKQYAPLVNASKPPGDWQTYDIIFMEPEFNEIGIMTKRGRLTVFHNGILVQNNIEILGTTEFIGMPKIGKNEIRCSYLCEIRYSYIISNTSSLTSPLFFGPITGLITTWSQSSSIRSIIFS